MFRRNRHDIPLVTFGGGRKAAANTPDMQIMQADPQMMLAQQRMRAPRRFMPNPLVIVLVVGVLAELSGNPKYQPSVIAGKAAGNFYGEIMQEDNNKTLDLKEQEPYADTLGSREAQASHWKGLCAASRFLDPEIAAHCDAMADAYFGEALPPARDYRDRYQPRQ